MGSNPTLSASQPLAAYGKFMIMGMAKKARWLLFQELRALKD